MIRPENRNAQQTQKQVASEIQGFFHDKKINFHFGYIEQGIGSSVGPGTIILGFYGDPKIRQLNK